MSLDLYRDRDGIPIPVLRWAELYEDQAYRHVAATHIHAAADPSRVFTVSTIWLGLSAGLFEELPLIFETMVFDNGDVVDGQQFRYPTLASARAGHFETVGSVAATVTDPVLTDIDDTSTPTPARAATPEPEPGGDLLARIDEVTTEPAARCWQCKGDIGKSVSDDFCSQHCQESWHAARSEPLTSYREAGHDFRFDAVRFQGAEPQGDGGATLLSDDFHYAARQEIDSGAFNQLRYGQWIEAPRVDISPDLRRPVPEVYRQLVDWVQRIREAVSGRGEPRALRFTQEQWDELYQQLRPFITDPDAPERLEDPTGSRMFGLPIERVATVEESTPHLAEHPTAEPRFTLMRGGVEIVNELTDWTWTSQPSTVAETPTGPVDLRITHDAVPLTIECTIDGHPFWYRSRHTRWELYQGREQDISDVDEHGHLTGPGVTWVATGECTLEDSLDPEFARRTIMDAWRHHVRLETLADLRNAYDDYQQRLAGRDRSPGLPWRTAWSPRRRTTATRCGW